MSAEAPTFAPEPRQPGTDALANLFDNPERRNALIDRVVFSSATQPQPGLETSVFEPLERHKRASIAKLKLDLLKADGRGYEIIDGNGANPFFRAQPVDVFEPVVPDATIQTQESFKDRLSSRFNKIKSKITTLKDNIVHSSPARVAGRAALATAIASSGGAVFKNEPVQASGFLVGAGGTNATAECIDDPNLMIIDLDYARKIISGEVVIATRDNLLAAAEAAAKGDTAVRQPITPEEALKNLIESAPDCLPKVDPTPTPEPTPKPTETPAPTETPDMRTAQDLMKTKDTKGTTPEVLNADVKALFENDEGGPRLPEDITTWVMRPNNVKKWLKICENLNSSKWTNNCAYILNGALDVLLMRRDGRGWKLALDVKNYFVEHAKRSKGELYQNLRNHYPVGYVPDISEYK